MQPKERKTRAYIDREKYNRIKKVTNLNTLTNEQVSKLMDVSGATVSRVKHSANFDDFVRIKKAENILAQRRILEKSKRESDAKAAYEEALHEATDDYVEKAKQVIKNEEDPQLTDILEELKEIKLGINRLVTIWETEKTNERWEKT